MQKSIRKSISFTREFYKNFLKYIKKKNKEKGKAPLSFSKRVEDTLAKQMKSEGFFDKDKE